MKKYKIRMECTSFYDVTVMAKNETEAKDEAFRLTQCPQNGMEFGEFLEVEEDEEVSF